MKKLNTVTLIGVDCVNIERLEQAATICTKDFEFAEVKLLTSLPSNSNHVVPIAPITSTEMYSEFVIRNLNQYVDTPHALIIQYDGFILNPDAWDDTFLDYDYIGAPWLVKDWSVDEFDFPPTTLGERVVGNGGFSLRSKKFLSLCQQFATDETITTFHPEDVVVCVHNRRLFEQNGITYAPVDVAERFSFEAWDKERNVWTNEFGFHGLSWTDISAWTQKHPEYTIDNTLK